MTIIPNIVKIAPMPVSLNDTNHAVAVVPTFAPAVPQAAPQRNCPGVDKCNRKELQRCSTESER